MNIPKPLQDHWLDNGQTLVDFVGGASSSRLQVDNIDSLSEVWKNRVAEARINNRVDLAGRADSIVKFLSNDRSHVAWLVWPKFRISALFEEGTGKFVLIDET